MSVAAVDTTLLCRVRQKVQKLSDQDCEAGLMTSSPISYDRALAGDPFRTVGKRMAIQMARDNREREPAAFRPEDEIDEVFARANPNPTTDGLPWGTDVLRSVSRVVSAAD